jgi:TatD DNase family protein
MLLDIHCHLDNAQFNDLGSVIDRAKKAGVKLILTNGVDHKTNVIALKLAKKYNIVKAALGVYPLFGVDIGLREGSYPMDKIVPVDVDNELKFISENKEKIIAVGEVGLDYTVKGYDDKQKGNFEKIIETAKKLKKPLIVHSRKAEKDVVEMLESSGVKKVVLHCFSGNFGLVKKAASLGYYFSIPTNIVHSEHFQKLVKEVNINQLLTETDAPYLSPFKGKRNEPANVIEGVKKIASIKGFTVEETSKNIWMNYQRLF